MELLVCCGGTDVEVTAGLVLPSTSVRCSLSWIGPASLIGGGASPVGKWGTKFVAGDINLSSLLPPDSIGFRPWVIGKGLPGALGLGLVFSAPVP